MFKILLTTTLLMIPGFLLSQGVTTASLNGTIKTQAGESSVGANVVAIHEPSGSTFGAALRTMDDSIYQGSRLAVLTHTRSKHTRASN